MSSDISPRDADHWAKQVTRLRLGTVPPEALNLNVTGNRVAGPMQASASCARKPTVYSCAVSTSPPLK
jgi:hypothetical protein